MEKPALLFLHFFGGSGRTWTPVAAALSDTFHCLTPDLPGWGTYPVQGMPQGGTTFPVGGVPQGGEEEGSSPFSVDAMARFALSQIDTLNGAPFAIVGHSMGGKVAQAVAATQPAGMVALILVAPSPAVPEPMTDTGRAQLRAAWGSEPEARRLVDAITFRPLPPQWDAIAYEDTLRASREAWQAWTDSGSREDISTRMSQITVPTRIFAGEHDSPLTPHYLARKVAARIAGADMIVIPGTKHLVPLEAPQMLADGIRAFVTPLL